MSPHIAIRPLRRDDTDGVVHLYGRADGPDPGLGPITPAAWDHFVALPQNRNGLDFRVAADSGRVIGIAECSLREQGRGKVRFFKIVVDPAMRRRGVASALLAELAQIDKPGDEPSWQSLCAPDWRGGVTFLAALGFTYIESEISMRCERLMAPSVTLSAAISIKRAVETAAYATAIARIHNAAYRCDAAFRSYAPAEMREVLAASEVWIVADREHVAGFCLIEQERERVWLESLAIEPAYQHRGLAQALAYGALHAAGVSRERTAGLNVSSVNQAAIEVYGRLGFERTGERCRYGAPHRRLAAALGQRMSVRASIREAPTLP